MCGDWREMGWGIKTEELDDLDKSNERKADRVINKRKEKNNIFIINFFFIQGHSEKERRLTEKKKTESIESKDKCCRRNCCQPVCSFARL